MSSSDKVTILFFREESTHTYKSTVKFWADRKWQYEDIIDNHASFNTFHDILENNYNEEKDVSIGEVVNQENVPGSYHDSQTRTFNY